MKTKILIVASVVFLTSILFAQPEKPKLVVGVVVDQMRFTDLYRYYHLYGEDGFKRIAEKGSNFTFAHYNYELTSTGPGHASIYTGTTPFFHGIIGNDFYDKKNKRMLNCVQDDSQTSVGTENSNGKKSPVNLIASTITDELKLFTNKKSKVISISIKDRGAILPGGHLADAAYWYDNKTGKFISSTYYMKQLPDWVSDFNSKKYPDAYLSDNWNLLLDKSVYEINSPDESPYEKDLFNEGKTSFPHSFKNLKSDEKYNAFQFTPLANQLVLDLAKEAIVNEKLGQNEYPDFLAISFSTPDLIAHEIGNYSYELMDIYLRIDRQIAELLNFLDQKIGKENYILFLTADHAAIETPAYLKENKMPVGGIGTNRVRDSLMSYVKREFKSDEIIEKFSNRQVFLNYEFINRNGLDFSEVQKKIKNYLRETFYEIQTVVTREYLDTQVATRTTTNSILNGWNPSRSGDVVFNLLPGYLDNFLEKGTTHGSAYSYDTHVPLIFYGWKIPAKEINKPVYVVDIAPTIANLLNINEPNACIGIPLIEK
ncbi:AP superfamily protein [Ignavibacterium album JCM 16511]|uniref:AP superfamily protein n=1 Tax=Ignavibacterium album (strain DSM 19864 / JCM 16511 / NBRC 101810 / Mat9-16) TaxID=945713 RepID=I0AK66_IGNAJ|nr:alkaline phosphatase PafA [Ignavibacterium album]AFH49373.1 AP superfamily protein [Ignavibacterium album JCM 16511]